MTPDRRTLLAAGATLAAAAATRALAQPPAAGGSKIFRTTEIANASRLATEEQARKLGTELYREVELEALIERGKDGVINGGKVLDFHPVDNDCVEPWDAWRKWYREVNRE